MVTSMIGILTVSYSRYLYTVDKMIQHVFYQSGGELWMEVEVVSERS